MPDRCPCGLPATYDACCGRFHRGVAAPTAALLMRSRYSAFVVEDRGYLRDTWLPRTRPARIDVGPGERWTGLEVLGATGGGLFDTAGTVAFRAQHRDGVVAEDSAFLRVDGRWFYTGPATVSDPFTTRAPRRA